MLKNVKKDVYNASIVGSNATKALKELKKGTLYRTISQMLEGDITEQSVCRFAQKHNLTSPRSFTHKKLTTEQKKEILRLEKTNKYNQKQIAEILGVSHSSVNKFLLNHLRTI